MVWSELALAALKEVSFGVVVFTAVQTASRELWPCRTAKSDVPLPMVAMAFSVFCGADVGDG